MTKKKGRYEICLFPLNQAPSKPFIAVQQAIAAYASFGVSSLNSGRLRAAFSFCRPKITLVSGLTPVLRRVAQSAHRHVFLGETRVVAGGLARHAGIKWPGVAGLPCEEGGCAAEAKRAGLIRNFQWKAYELPGQNANKGPE